jgi:hypothetical protein
MGACALPRRCVDRLEGSGYDTESRLFSNGIAAPMKASVAGRVRNTVLPRTRPLLPVFEAVINAFQAIEETGKRNGHVIRIECARQRTLDHSKHAPFELSHIHI